MGKMYEMLKTMKLLGGTGGTGPIDYDNLENLPTMNGNTIKGTMVGSDLGLQDELTTGQLAAVNSGITSEDVEQISTNKTNISNIQGKTNRIIMDSTESTNVYVQATQPTGTIPEGSIWFDTAVSGT
jgi:hypothetical protein